MEHGIGVLTVDGPCNLEIDSGRLMPDLLIARCFIGILGISHSLAATGGDCPVGVCMTICMLGLLDRWRGGYGDNL